MMPTSLRITIRIGLLSAAIMVLYELTNLLLIYHYFRYEYYIAGAVIIALVTGIILALVDVIYCNYLNPGYATYMVEESQKALIADGKSLAEIATSLPSLKQQWTTGSQMFQALIGQTVLGTVISLVMAIFIKAKIKTHA